MKTNKIFSALRLAALMIFLSNIFVLAQSFAEMSESRRFEKQATDDYKAKNFAGFLAYMKAAALLRPNHPRLLYNLAAAYSLNRKSKESLQILKQIAAMGLYFPIEKDDDFKSLFNLKEFAALQKDFKFNQQVVNKSVKAFSIADKTLIIEGIAYQAAAKRFFIGSIHQRKIISVDENGRASDFSTDSDNLWSVSGLKVDEQRQILWACSTAFPQMKNFQKEDEGKSGIFKYDLRTGKLLKKYLLSNSSERHSLGDLTINGKGDVYVTDSVSPNIYRIDSQTDALEVFLTSPTFASLQGLTFTPDEKTLFIADYSKGIFKIDISSKRITQLLTAKNIAALGIDGLYYYRNNLIAVQNGTNPNRIVEFFLDRSQTKITGCKNLEANHADFNEPTLGVIIGDNFYFIANSQWGFVNEKAELAEEKLKEPVILRFKF